MEAYARPLRALYDAVEAMVRRPSVRALHVEVDAPLRDAAVEMAEGLEYHAENRSPFVALEDPDPATWPGALRAAHAARREAMAEHGHALPALPPPPEPTDARRAIALTLGQLLDARCEPLRGLVVIVAPTHVHPGGALAEDLRAWLSVPRLGAARFVVIEPAPATLLPLEGAERLRLEHDEDEVRAELGRRLDAAAMAPLDAPGPAQTGAAWPVGDAPPGSGAGGLDDARAQALADELGVPKGLFGTAIREVRPLVLRGALALRGGDAVSAMRFQGRAVERASAAGLGREALVLELVLCTYMAHAGEHGLARERYLDLAGRAIESGHRDVAAQAQMAAGSLQRVAGDGSGASVTYATAGRTAKDGGDASLSIEGYRMAAQLATEDGNRDQARRLYGAALEQAAPMSASAVRQTSAGLAARQLAEVLRQDGLSREATDMDARARAMGG